MAGFGRLIREYSPTSKVDTTSNPATAARRDTAPSTQGSERHPSERATEDAHTTELRDKHSAACPVLCVGSKLDKTVQLKPDRWIVVGRDKHCQLLLNNHSVSRNHCSFRWDPRTKKVEIKDTSGTGTKVNGTLLRGERLPLKHGDRVCVDGKGARYEMIIDMRPVYVELEDPRILVAEAKKAKPPPAQVARKRDLLRTELLESDRKLKDKEALYFAIEKEYYEIQTRRRLREMEDQDRTEELEAVLKKTADLEQKLTESREAWSKKMKDTMEENMEKVVPLVKQSAEIQEKFDKLMLKKAEIEKEIHPERLALLPDIYGNPAGEDGPGERSVQSNLSSDEEPMSGPTGNQQAALTDAPSPQRGGHPSASTPLSAKGGAPAPRGGAAAAGAAESPPSAVPSESPTQTAAASAQPVGTPPSNAASQTPPAERRPSAHQWVPETQPYPAASGVPLTQPYPAMDDVDETQPYPAIGMSQASSAGGEGAFAQDTLAYGSDTLVADLSPEPPAKRQRVVDDFSD